tara:strand:+ start:23 stop:274 length:252 start_codon:yes stop_codon:yes gene_type:complete
MNNYIPTAKEFNRKMHECVKYQKLVKLEKHLSETIDWFSHQELGKGMFELYDRVLLLIKEIPKESRNFDIEVHGQTLNNEINK